MPALRAITEARARRRGAGAHARRAAAILVAAGLAGVVLWAIMIRMPGTSYAGPFAPLTPHERDLEAALRRDVQRLAGDIGDRSAGHPSGLGDAAGVIERALAQAGYEVKRQRFESGGQPCDNLEVEIRGAASKDEIVVVGAHYDTVRGTPGADDNASGVAAMLALARAFAGAHPARTLRFVAFAAEEPPFFQTPRMGSAAYARRSRDRGEHVVAMLSLETLGLYSDQPGSQRYPTPFGLFYPSAGDFVAFVGDVSSRALVRRTVASFRASARFPSEGVAAPGAVPGVMWSDHWAFRQEGYPAVMVTDTAPFRNPGYHTADDTPERLTFAPMARVVAGLEAVVGELAGRE
jgi:hypothetical protein